MLPAQFDYVRPADVQEAVRLLAQYGDEGKLLAGGQSLIPLLKLRFALPQVLIAFTELITFDEDGNCIGSNFMDYLLPTSWETPNFETYATVTPSPHHPLGAKGVGESATVGSPAAYVNAVVDALAHLGVRNIEMPVTSDKVWTVLRREGVTE